MVSFWTKLTSTVLLLTSSLLPVTTAQAHPHYWVTVQWTLELDSQGKLYAMEQRWLFDDMVSAVLLDGMAALVPGRPPASELKAESQRMVKDLAPYDYYTHVWLDNKPLLIPEPVSHGLSLVEGEESSVFNPRPSPHLVQLHLRFEWSQPQPVLGRELRGATYDPTYYASLNMKTLDNLTLKTPGNIQCEPSLTPPSPDESMVAYAFSLDKNQRDSQGLGEHFAERLVIECESLEPLQ